MLSDYTMYSLIPNKKVVLLQSGGLDSLVCASILSKMEFEIHHVFINYGQNSFQKERECVLKIVEKYGGTLHECSISLPWLSTSCIMTNSKPIEDGGVDNVLSNIETGVYVPMRNAMFISMASSLADSLQIPNICVALNGIEDVDGNPLSFSPDSHATFAKKMEDSLTSGSSIYHARNELFFLLTPLMGLYKNEVISLGVEFGADFSLSWSCYNSGEKPCGKCSACEMRAGGFVDVGIEDPALQTFNML